MAQESQRCFHVNDIASMRPCCTCACSDFPLANTCYEIVKLLSVDTTTVLSVVTHVSGKWKSNWSSFLEPINHNLGRPAFIIRYENIFSLPFLYVQWRKRYLLRSHAYIQVDLFKTVSLPSSERPFLGLVPCRSFGFCPISPMVNVGDNGNCNIKHLKVQG